MTIALDKIDLDRLEKDFECSDWPEFYRFFHDQIEMKLASRESTLAMLPAYLHSKHKFKVPADAFAIDWGGTRMRFSHFLLEPTTNSSFKLKHLANKDCDFDWQKLSPETLFLKIAQSFSQFLNDTYQGLSRSPLGLTFSFAFEQSSLHEAKILSFSKGYDASEFLGKNPLELLKNAFYSRSIKIEPKAIVNDTSASFLAGIDHPFCSGSAILGTGFNLSYLVNEQQTKEMLYVLEAAQLDLSKRWTDYDQEADLGSKDYLQHPFEKMLSGKYLGRIFKTIVSSLANNLSDSQAFFLGKTQTMSLIESANKEEIRDLFLFQGLNLKGDPLVLQRICRIISDRSVNYLAHSLVALARYQNSNFEKKRAFVIDGSVYYRYFNYSKRLLEQVKKLSNDKLILIERPNASALGAALASLIQEDAISKIHT